MRGIATFFPINLGLTWVFIKVPISANLNNLLEGTGKNMRHEKTGKLEESNQLAIRALIEAALSERKKFNAK